MEYLPARKDSYKSKRSKASSSKHASKWPHPPSFKATPKSLAEAGFYFDPDSDNPDNVTCFMCGKSLSGWEKEDDPFAIHYDKSRNTCSWAVVRCQRSGGEDSFDSSDPTRNPTSKAMEKARLDTFANVWPHDAFKGHGANSKALAKAGFICNASGPEDDTVLCLYCNIVLSEWDDTDDPLEEHRKRNAKSSSACPFLKAYSGTTLSKSTAKRPKAASKPPSRSVSRSAAAKEASSVPADDSDDELAIVPADNQPTRTASGRQSKASSARASSVTTKTPASRRSSRGTTGKTPGSRTVSSDVEETDIGSEGEAGKRTTKAKRKTGGRTKTRVSAIAEEENEADRRVAEEDVEMKEPEPEPVLGPEPEPVKKKRGRPPKSATTKPLSQAKGRKVQVTEDEEDVEGVEQMDVESTPAPVAKKAHGRTRSKANLPSDTEGPPVSSKSTHTRTKSGPKAMAKQEEGGVEESGLEPGPVSKKKGKQAASRAQKEEEEPDEVPSAPPQKLKARAVSRSKSKATLHISDEDEAEVPGKQPPQESSRSRGETGRSVTSQGAKTSTERNSSLSEDAGYATAEPPPEHMDVDELPPMAVKNVPPPREVGRSSSGNAVRPTPTANGSQPSRASSARPSSSRPAMTASKDSVKVVEIDSDGEETGLYGAPAPVPVKGKARASRSDSIESTNAVKKPTSHAKKKKLQVEALIRAPPPRSSREPVAEEDVLMKDESPRSSIPPAVRNATPNDGASRKPDVAVGVGTPVSAVHRSDPPSSIPDTNIEHNVPMPDSAEGVLVVASSSPKAYHPYLAHMQIEKLTSLTEEEADMTLEQYIRREMEIQCAQIKSDGERRISEFKQKAAATRNVIETS